eukprot:3932404-Rhodomonas_salina.1
MVYQERATSVPASSLWPYSSPTAITRKEKKSQSGGYLQGQKLRKGDWGGEMRKKGFRKGDWGGEMRKKGIG